LQATFQPPFPEIPPLPDFNPLSDQGNSIHHC
jgi:hypothetical protein